MNPVQDQNLSAPQVVQLTHSMLSVAMVDGLNQAETELIRAFYESARGEGMPVTDDMMESLATAPMNVNELAGCSPDFADTVVLMSIMTSYADGILSEAERNQIKSIASALGMHDEQLATHLAHVQNDLIGALSHLPDSESVANIFRQMSPKI